MMSISSIPELTASSTTYCIVGLLYTGNISLGCALVAGRKRVPRPAAGITAFILSTSYNLIIEFSPMTKLLPLG